VIWTVENQIYGEGTVFSERDVSMDLVRIGKSMCAGRVLYLRVGDDLNDFGIFRGKTQCYECIGSDEGMHCIVRLSCHLIGERE